MRPARLDHSFFGNEPRSHLGALLLRKGLVTNEELDQALAEREQGELLGEALCRLRICFENDIARVLAEQANVDFVDIAISGVDRRAVVLLRKREAQKMHAIPVRLHPDETVSVAVADPTDARRPRSAAAGHHAVCAPRGVGHRLQLGPSRSRHRLRQKCLS